MRRGLTAFALACALAALQCHRYPRLAGEVRWRVPEAFGRTLEGHLARIRAFDPATTLTGIYENPDVNDPSGEDLNHVHLYTDAHHPSRYASAQEFLQDVRVFLYHTDESGKRWWAQTAPPRERVQRSFLVTPDGNMRPAIETVAPADTANYAENGTVYDVDVARAFADLRYGNAELDSRYVPRLRHRGASCVVDHELILRPDPAGRFRFGTQRFDASLSCQFE